ncbi:MAG: hypothetical protein HXS48_03280 [Theionarchaea archaeon]|nr:hypothetical protein [Theionarchaea archaeon]
MDEQVIQQAKVISREIVKKEFPEEEEYFDFLFDLTIQEIKELEPGKEAEFLREMRAVHPELVLGYTPIIIIITVQFLGEFTYRSLKKSKIKDENAKKAAEIVENKNEQQKISVISDYLIDYLEKKEKNQ